MLLRPREFALLKILMKEPNRPFARTKLSEVLSGEARSFATMQSIC
ncbi:helix-turn-helix domain-containing protein [Paraburkholderia kirstenboschensis]